jgi:F-type H+-transporting ATPase subunit b
MQSILSSLGISFPLLVTQIIGFLILIPLLNKFLVKPINAILDKRQQEIKDTYDQLDADRESMLHTRQEYEKRLAGIEAEARETIQVAIKEAQALRDNLVADAKKQAQAIIDEGRNDTERDRQKAFLEMRKEVVSLAIAAAGKVVNETLDVQRHTKLVDEFISNVGSGSIVEYGRGVGGNEMSNGAHGGSAA